MRALAICQDELVIRTLEDVLAPGFEIEFLVESRPLARRLHDEGVPVTAGDPATVDTYLRADLTPNTCVIVEDNGKRSLKEDPDGDPRRRRQAAFTSCAPACRTRQGAGGLPRRVPRNHRIWSWPSCSRPTLTPSSADRSRARGCSSISATSRTPIAC